MTNCLLVSFVKLKELSLYRKHLKPVINIDKYSWKLFIKIVYGISFIENPFTKNN